MFFLFQPFRVLWKLWLFVLFANSIILGYPLIAWMLATPRRFHIAFRIIRIWSRLLLLASGVVVRVQRETTLPKGPFIICPNHTSYLDILSMYCTFRGYFVFMGKAEILGWPLFNAFFSKGMNISVNRASNRGSHEAFERAKQEVDKGHSIVIFPEGTIPLNAPKMKPFKNGAFKLAIEKNIPIVPVTFVNNWKRLQVGAALRRAGSPGVAKVIVHAPVYPADYAEKGMLAMKKDIFETIQQPLIERYGD